MNRIIFIMIALMVLFTRDEATAASGTFSGRVWNDLDRDGIQDPGEPPMTNFPIYVSDLSLNRLPDACRILTNFTDGAGYYEFTHAITNNDCLIEPYLPATSSMFRVLFGDMDVYGWSPYNVGDDDSIDSDMELPFVFIDTDNVIATNVDLGIYPFIPGISLEMAINGFAIAKPYYVTNGTPITILYKVTNTGDVRLSYIGLVDDTWYDFYGAVDCPGGLGPLESEVFSTQVVAYASFTNTGFVSAVPVDYLRCDMIPSFLPIADSDHTTVIVVTNNPLEFIDGDVYPNWWEIQYGFDPLNSNSPNINSDSDWMTNYEEFLAGTDPTNGASFFSDVRLTVDNLLSVDPTATNRIYNLWRSTNLIEDPQTWSLIPPELTGTGSAVFFTFPDNDPSGHFRTGVRIP